MEEETRTLEHEVLHVLDRRRLQKCRALLARDSICDAVGLVREPGLIVMNGVKGADVELIFIARTDLVQSALQADVREVIRQLMHAWVEQREVHVDLRHLCARRVPGQFAGAVWWRSVVGCG